jgi:hypothetical protein
MRSNIDLQKKIKRSVPQRWRSERSDDCILAWIHELKRVKKLTLQWMLAGCTKNSENWCYKFIFISVSREMPPEPSALLLTFGHTWVLGQQSRQPHLCLRLLLLPCLSFPSNTSLNIHLVHIARLKICVAGVLGTGICAGSKVWYKEMPAHLFRSEIKLQVK